MTCAGIALWDFLLNSLATIFLGGMYDALVFSNTTSNEGVLDVVWQRHTFSFFSFTFGIQQSSSRSRLLPGCTFGESLLTNGLQPASIFTTSNCELLRVQKEDFQIFCMVSFVFMYMDYFMHHFNMLRM